MKTTTKKLSDTKVELKVVLDASDLKPARAAALAKLVQEIKVPGFRKGKAPVNLADKYLNENDINS